MAVIGASPITFISEDTTSANLGVQFQVPLSVLTITSGKVDRSGWVPSITPSTADLAVLDYILASFLASGVITAPPS
jgi:hypothetical protein